MFYFKKIIIIIIAFGAILVDSEGKIVLGLVLKEF